MTQDLLARVIELIRKARIDLSNEKAAQADIESILVASGVEHVREATLSPGNIVDFAVGEIVIEVKLKGQKRQIYKQLERYAKHPQVSVVILVSSLSMGLPAQICGKDVYFISMGESWL